MHGSAQRQFFSAPPSASALLAALLEPSIVVLSYLAIVSTSGRPIDTPDITLCLIAFLLAFPGRNRFYQPPLAALADILTSWAALLAVMAACAFATRSVELFDPRVLLLWALTVPTLQALAHLTGRRLMLTLAAQPQMQRRAVVVGGGALGQRVAASLQARSVVGHRFLGYFDDRGPARQDDAVRGTCLGALDTLAAYVRQHGVQEVYITLPLGSQPRIAALLAQLQGTTASLYYCPDVFGINIIQGRLQELNGVPVVGLCETPFTGTNALVKRACDIVLASVILVLIAPLLAAIAVGVKMSSPGPVLFRQRRNGLDGSEITVYKFRSMTTQDNGPVVRQATRDDPRITRFGAFLRRTSLDELPQFINVLQGRMSIVGPRPHAVAHNEQYRDLIRAYMVRHKVRPGITGWAQVNGLRGETDTVDKMRARVEYDLQYLRNWSLGLDLRIIVRTVKLIVADRHAY